MAKQTQRVSAITRKTAETDIALTLAIDGRGAAEIDTGIPFFDHMLTLFAKHGLFDLKVKAKGDVAVDYHHTVEDVGIVLGQAGTGSSMSLSGGSTPSGTSAMMIPLNTKVRLDELIQGIAVQSGNDAAITLAEGIYLLKVPRLFAPPGQARRSARDLLAELPFIRFDSKAWAGRVIDRERGARGRLGAHRGHGRRALARR